MATLGEEVLDSLQREFIDQFTGAGSIGRPRIVADEEVVILWQYSPDVTQDSQAAESRVKHSDGCLLHFIILYRRHISQFVGKGSAFLGNLL